MSHSGASIYIDKYGNGQYFNGDQSTRSMQGSSFNDNVMWYGSFPGECQVTCVKAESGRIFCSFRLGSDCAQITAFKLASEPHAHPNTGGWGYSRETMPVRMRSLLHVR